MSARLSPQREAEICERAEAATPGHWGSHRDLNGAYTVQARPRTTRYGMENDGNVAAISACRGDSDAYGNARFIGHAREDVPALLAELAAVRAERDEARQHAAVVAEFVAERAEYITAIKNCPAERGHDYDRWQGHAESRRQLAERLGLSVAWPAEYGQEATS